MRTAFMIFLGAFMMLSSGALAASPNANGGFDNDTRPGSGERVGLEAKTPSTRQAGGYNNYCQTWRVDRAKDRALFGACMAND